MPAAEGLKKKPAAPKPRKKAAAAPKPPKTPKPPKIPKQPKRPKNRDEHGNLGGGLTSIASRKRRAHHITKLSLQIDDDDEDLSQFNSDFGPDSHANSTWGVPSTNAIVAGSKKRKSAFSKSTSSRKRTTQSFQSYDELFPGLRPVFDPDDIEPNTPARSAFLRCPLEVRENVYTMYFSTSASIMMHHNWEQVERGPSFNLHILQICKQVTAEALPFIYRSNTFHALLRRNSSANLPDWVIPRIPTTQLREFKNLILDCPRENWNVFWYEKAAKSIEVLVAANPILESLTIVVFPEKVGISDTAMGMQANPTTFADFFWDKGRIVAGLKKLRCKNFRIVMKKASGKRILIEIDMQGLHANPGEENNISWFDDDALCRISRESRKERINVELEVLREKVEAIFDDENTVAEMGWCRILDHDERSTKA